MYSSNKTKLKWIFLLISISGIACASTLLNKTNDYIVVNGHPLNANEKIAMPESGGSYYQIDAPNGKSLGLFTVNPNYSYFLNKPAVSIYKCGNTIWYYGYTRSDLELVKVKCEQDTIIMSTLSKTRHKESSPVSKSNI